METLEKSEFLAFVFLYAASADLVLSKSELDLIADKVGLESLKRAKTHFDQYSDYERIEFILAHRDLYFKDEESKENLLSELKMVFLADNVFSIEEQNLFRALNRLL